MPERPWWETLDDQMASVEPTRTPRRSMAVNYPHDLYALVLEAAKARGMSMTAYQRRASLSFAQYDTGFDWLTEMAAEPPIGGFVAPGHVTRAEGRGFGYWRIVELRDHVRNLGVEL